MELSALVSIPLWLAVGAAGVVILLLTTSAATFARLRSFDLTPLHERLAALEAETARAELSIRQELSRARVETAGGDRRAREESAQSMKQFSDSMLKQLGSSATHQNELLDGFAKQLARLTAANEERMELVRKTVDTRLQELRDDNGKRLEEMRKTVDEKLEATLNKRLGASFKIVSERLEQVHKGLGEMQNLATGVGDLKRVLTNVKTRGVWGEIQLERLLEQVLTPTQYETNVATKPRSAERVEFCIRLPGPSDDIDATVWLPIDAKFPQEDYQRLLDAQEKGDNDAAAIAAKQLETRIRNSAKDIRDKYLNPPLTTDFAILFLPTEGLYAEVVRHADLLDQLQRTYRVVVAGPTTLAALLNSLQMGFRTLAIEKRSSEVWQLLASVKSEFGKFGGILEKVQTKLTQASSAIEDAASKSRNIERKLTKVGVLPDAPAPELVTDAKQAQTSGSDD
jgi:DNA recombination protein RmuC